MCRPHRNSFGIKSNGEDILSFPVRDELGLGITSDAVTIPGMVSFYEEHKVRVERGYSFSEWYALQPMERAIEVALSRIENMIEYKKNFKEIEKMKRESRRK